MIYIYIYIYTCAHIYIHIYIYVCMYVCVCVNIYVCMFVFIYSLITIRQICMFVGPVYWLFFCTDVILYFWRHILNMKWMTGTPDTEVFTREWCRSIESPIIIASMQWAGHIVWVMINYQSNSNMVNCILMSIYTVSLGRGIWIGKKVALWMFRYWQLGKVVIEENWMENLSGWCLYQFWEKMHVKHAVRFYTLRVNILIIRIIMRDNLCTQVSFQEQKMWLAQVCTLVSGLKRHMVMPKHQILHDDPIDFVERASFRHHICFCLCGSVAELMTTWGDMSEGMLMWVWGYEEWKLSERDYAVYMCVCVCVCKVCMCPWISIQFFF